MEKDLKVTKIILYKKVNTKNVKLYIQVYNLVNFLGGNMSRNSKLISENLREEIARELGVYDQVKKDGGSWGNVSSKDCGNIVSKAIEIANRSVEK